ncbi:hypothetical protein FLJC2902T_13090 [Flavobacterium limnosediminis JC2902]|uniref:Uncharacterized protein n=1 Tax=Flavobacterium limnosediminis JC2902 TaxID=1341181 RepID=V6SPW4_9FLAO|nr:hypothetical protein [Flavobacterium limnosediminis]ESU28718.1 hypothetical protein FLJC2902T_13090 [Flavobacterium limnosediminis JC2902]
MDTEIKSTLFHFVSMRAPELNSDHETKPGFITQTNDLKGVFNDAIDNLPEGASKLTALQNEATNFSVNALSIDDLKNLNPELYEFSVWLAKNKIKATETEIEDNAEIVINKNLDLKTIWENLFYQVITQKDFYAKEVLIQIFLAHYVCNDNKGKYKERALAKIVLPKDLFVENNLIPETDDLLNGIDNTSEVNFTTATLNRLEKQAISKENTLVLNRLKIELEAAEKVFKKEYEEKHKTEYKTYQADIKPIIDQYNSDIETAKTNWCSIKDPSNTSPYDPIDPCQQPPAVPAPELPEFDFSFRPELDEDFLASQLSPESLEVYQNLKNPQNPEDDFEIDILSRIAIGNSLSFDSFESVKNSINQLIDVESETVINNTIDNGSTSVVIGGTTLTVPNTTVPLTPFQYEIKTRRRSGFITSVSRTLQIMVGIPDPSWKITAVKYKMTRTDNSFVEKTSSSVTHYLGYDALLNLSMTGITSNLKELSITFQFANGKSASVVILNFALSSIYKNFISLPADNQTGGNTSGGNSTVSPQTAFIPKGFGVKQIGIADYNKVEQSIQGYVEGEVAHIENVMAREFKEKSTRKLRRSEITETTSTETEKEQLSDTTSVDRFEMQSEVAKVIANAKDFSAGAGMTYSPTPQLSLSANANFATHNSKEESTRQAVTNAKEITERALGRIVSKVKEERIEKIIEEFEENNIHGFDNRRGDKHVVGVYRWVDKVFKNQIVNYGKRLMFEFMIPEPARLHKLAMETLVLQNKATVLVKPEDPRTSATNKLENYSQLDDTRLKYWTGKYNVEIPEKLKEIIVIGESINAVHDGSSIGRHEGNSGKAKITIPEGYETITGNLTYNSSSDNDGMVYSGMMVSLGSFNSVFSATRSLQKSTSFSLIGYKNEVPVSYTMSNHFHANINASVTCKLTVEAKTKWQQETFNAIINAYDDALDKYNEALATEEANGVQILGTNPGFYRQIENTILRKNCISYLISSNPDVKRTFGKNFYTKNNNDNTFSLGNTIIDQNADLDDYSSFVKFMEQAFEWDIMSYNFYPYYWGNRQNWVEMYQFDKTNDHIFRAFMQSGMARVIVTVRPGFEEAVRYYMQTGQIWNGGEVPVIGDELFLSIVEEMQKPEGEKVGKAWPTRIPTSMTILQAQSIGLNVTSALPFNTNLSDFEHPEQVPQSSQIALNEAQIGGSGIKIASANLKGQIEGNSNVSSKILLKHIDGSIKDLTYCESLDGTWELNNIPAGKYELLLDADNDFPNSEFTIMEGQKDQVVELEDDQTIEVLLEVKKI